MLLLQLVHVNWCLNKCLGFVLKDVNHIAVERAFCGTFASSQLLTRHQTGQILAFVIANSDIMCDLPSDVQDVIDARLGRHSVPSINASLQNGYQLGKLSVPADFINTPLSSSSALHTENFGKNN